MGDKTSIYLTEEIRKLLRSPPRGASKAIAVIVDRYNSLLESERRKMAKYFSAAEWKTLNRLNKDIVDYDTKTGNCSPTLSADAMRGRLLASVQDALDDEIKGSGLTRTELEKRIQALSLVQQFAVLELIEEQLEIRFNKEAI